jgi:hypothetical protein
VSGFLCPGVYYISKKIEKNSVKVQILKIP